MRTAEKQRVEKLLEDAQIKLSVVASDIFGVSGREMMAALIAGQRNPRVLAQFARGRMRAKVSQLEEAFTGRFTDHHGFLLAKMLTRIDQVDSDLADLDVRIGAEIAPFADAAARLDQIPGIGPDTAYVILSEIGIDMTRFPRGAPVLVGPVRTGGQGIRRTTQEQRDDRTRQSLPGSGPRRGSRQRRQDRHLPRRTLPTHCPTTRQEESHRRGRSIHPGDRLASPQRQPSPIPRPRRRLLRHPRRHRTR